MILAVAATLTGCATGEYAQYSKAQVEIATAKHNADTAKYNAFAAIAQQGDATAKVAAVMAMALGSNSTGAQNAIQAPQPNQALQWASILVPGLTQVAGMRYNYLSQQTSSNNATALGMSTNAAFVGLAGKIQAPGAVTTNTLSGTGTLGSGAYNTIDRNDMTTTTLSGTGNLGSGSYSLTDRNDVTTPAPTVITPVTPIVPTVITPVTPIVPVINTQPLVAPVTP